MYYIYIKVGAISSRNIPTNTASVTPDKMILMQTRSFTTQNVVYLHHVEVTSPIPAP